MSWGDCLQNDLKAFEVIRRIGIGRKWVAFGVVVKDGLYWIAVARNVGMWYRGLEKGANTLDNARRRANPHHSNLRHQREAGGLVQKLRV